MKSKLHTLFLYPLVLIFSAFLKGKKTEYKNFFKEKKAQNNTDKILKIISENGNFYDQIKQFFDKTSPLYDKTDVEFKIDTTKAPEEKKYFAFDFFRVINIYYTLSMLSSKIPNENITAKISFEKQKLTDMQTDNFLRYVLLIFASQKVDTFTFDTQLLQDKQSISAYETLISYLENSTIVKFSNAKNLYVITCKQGKKTFDIIWSSSSNIELTEFHEVFDKFGKSLTKDIKITNSPIYAFHK